MQKRKLVDELYREKLSGIKGLKIVEKNKRFESNYSYFPVLIEDDYPLSRDDLYEKLKSEDIFARRYFYPLISDAAPFKVYSLNSGSVLKIAKKRSLSILCLPIYPELEKHALNRIIGIIKE